MLKPVRAEDRREARRRAAEVARLNGLFLKASGEDIAYELAQKMLQLAGTNAVPFLIRQAAGNDFRAEAAIGALHSAPALSSERWYRDLKPCPIASIWPVLFP